MIDDALAVKRLAELGHPTRLAVFRLLVKGNRQGLTVGTIQSKLEIPGSTLSHHLSRLISAGLVTQHREGRELRCQARMESLDDLMKYLTAECCSL